LQSVKSFLRSTFPGTIDRYRALRSSLQRLRRGDGNVHVFRSVFEQNRWGSDESKSGTGSVLAATASIREALPPLLHRLGVSSLLDAPCGDFNWMQTVDLGSTVYIGADVVPAIVEKNHERFGTPQRRFVVRDIISDDLPSADAILCRDCLVHLSFAHATMALRNFKRSGAKYLLTTTFTSRTRNWDIATGGWRPLNLQLEPFRFPAPLELVDEQCVEGDGAFRDKTLGLWLLADLDI
jgi:hypothetical protein